MKNLMTYTPEPFENLEIMDAEYDALVGEGEMDEEVVRSRGTRGIRRPGGRRAGRMPMLSKRVKPVKPFRPKFPMRPLMPVVPVPFPYVPMGSNALNPANNAAADKSRSSAGQSAGGEGSFANAPAQDVSSEHIRWVQETLNRALGLRLFVDGIMNRETRSAVRMFQERKGLPVTGLVGPETEEALQAEGGQAAAEFELLEGEWEMPGSWECSCGGREMEEFVFEAEPFGGAEFEDEFEVATGRVISYSEVGNDRFSVPAQESLMRMSKDPAKSADAVGLLEAVKSRRLLGIWCVNWKASSDRAQQHGSTWWNVIPKGEDAVLMLDPDNPLGGAPLIAFRRTMDTRPKTGCGKMPKETTPSYLPQRLDAALIRAWQSLQLLKSNKLTRCYNNNIMSAETATCLPMSNIVPSGYGIGNTSITQVDYNRDTLFMFELGDNLSRTVEQWNINLDNCQRNDLIGEKCTVSVRDILSAGHAMADCIIRDLRKYFAIIARFGVVEQNKIEIQLIGNQREYYDNDGNPTDPIVEREIDRVKKEIADRDQIEFWLKARYRILDQAGSSFLLCTRQKMIPEQPLIAAEFTPHTSVASFLGGEYRINPFTWFSSSGENTMRYSNQRSRMAFSPIAIILHEIDHKNNCIFSNIRSSCNDSDPDRSHNDIIPDIDTAIGSHPYIGKRFAYSGGWNYRCTNIFHETNNKYPDYDFLSEVYNGLRVYIDLPLKPGETPTKFKQIYSEAITRPIMQDQWLKDWGNWIVIPSDCTLRSGIRCNGPYRANMSSKTISLMQPKGLGRTLAKAGYGRMRIKLGKK